MGEAVGDEGRGAVSSSGSGPDWFLSDQDWIWAGGDDGVESSRKVRAENSTVGGSS